jgi:hypothetical protein
VRTEHLSVYDLYCEYFWIGFGDLLGGEWSAVRSYLSLLAARLEQQSEVQVRTRFTRRSGPTSLAAHVC